MYASYHSIANYCKWLQVAALMQLFPYWRTVRGDGNCFYRAVIFAVLDKCIRSGTKRNENIMEFFRLVDIQQYLSPAHVFVLQMLKEVSLHARPCDIF